MSARAYSMLNAHTLTSSAPMWAPVAETKSALFIETISEINVATLACMFLCMAKPEVTAGSPKGTTK